ncbi:hypothetical protein GS399_02910 [Pedobacter sp. HMF7647]|uniref:Activator of Hsp90 ATPase homologue 1/2-like C-terminal domain-containing protein n=1 Tax=Hufsiella arboris TaxID=2695275 RepID=A0A7K1Y5P9_9SPHI|nr:SRPBCC family protein [Hufsiella arboris]MXV49907.1 hypothetical protein [Hufsiella arboris]
MKHHIMENGKDLTIEISQNFEVSKEYLYKAWTVEDDLKQWWKPFECLLAHASADIRKGGKVQYEFNDKTGNKAFDISGEYKEVKENEALVYSWNWNVAADEVGKGEFELSIHFSVSDNGSSLQIKQNNFISEEALLPHREGWEKQLANLKDYLENKDSGSTAEQPNDKENDEKKDAQETGEKNEKEVSGYNETPEQDKVAE